MKPFESLDHNFKRLKSVHLEESEKTEILGRLETSIHLKRQKRLFHFKHSVVSIATVFVFLIISSILLSSILKEDGATLGSEDSISFTFTGSNFPTLHELGLHVEETEHNWLIRDNKGTIAGQIEILDSKKTYEETIASIPYIEKSEAHPTPFETLYLLEHVKRNYIIQTAHYFFTHENVYFYVQLHISDHHPFMQEKGVAIVQDLQREIVSIMNGKDSYDFRAYLLERTDEEGTYVAIINENMNGFVKQLRENKTEMTLYQLKLTEETKILDASHNVTDLENFSGPGNTLYEVWVKEQYQEQISTLEVNSDDPLKDVPVYTVLKLQEVFLSNEEYMASYYATNDDELVLYIYFGDELDEKQLKMLMNEVQSRFDFQTDNIELSIDNTPSQTLQELIGIDEYPVFLLFDHEKLLHVGTHLDELEEYVESLN